MRLLLTTAPAEEPIPLEEAKLHLKVDADETTEDALIAGWITSARREAERLTGRALVAQTWEAKMDEFPNADEIVLPITPLVSVTSIKDIDPDGTLQTLSSTTYTVDTSGVQGRVYLQYGESWPSIRIEPNAVRVVFVAGYGDASQVPEDLRSWMLLKIGSLHAHREGVFVGTIATRLPDIESLALGERVGL